MSDVDFDLSEWRWLQDNPAFAERPATFDEFLGPRYLNNRKAIRPGAYEVLKNVIGSEVNTSNPTEGYMAMMAGAIGIGKSYTSGVLLTYVVHWTLCLKDPQEFFGLDKGSKIAFAIMSTTEKQARGVAFDNVKARIKFSPWFNDPAHPERLPNPKFKNIVEWTDRYISILPGTSEETSYEGYNILGAVIDEMDSHKITDRKDYGEQGFDCADEATQILTRSGWKFHHELIPGEEVMTLNHDSGLAEWQIAEAVHEYPVHDQEMISWEGKELSALTTPDHRWPIVDNKKNRKWTTSSDIKLGHHIPLSARVGNLPTRKTHSDELVEAVAWFWTEGTFVRKGRGSSVCQSHTVNPIYTERMKSCLVELFGEPSLRIQPMTPQWREYVRPSKGMTEFHFGSVLTDVFREHCPGRVVSYEFLNSLTQEQLELFVDVSLMADGHEGKLNQKDHESTERFAYAVLLSGRGVSVREVTENYLGYRSLQCRRLKKLQSSPRAAAKAPGSAFRIDRVKHTGTVWCPRTANKTWMARRNGSVYFTGNTIYNRMNSRFDNRGFIFLIGQMKSRTGFAQRKWDELEKKGHFVYRCTIWDSRGWEHYKDPTKGELFGVDEDGDAKHFFYDTQRYEVVPSQVVKWGQREVDDTLLKVPLVYMDQFMTNGPKALKDLAGMPPLVGDPFIPDASKVLSARLRWMENNPGRAIPMDRDGRVGMGFKAENKIKRVMHIDMGLSGDGDALGMAMGHVSGVREVDGEVKAMIEFDLLRQWTVKPGRHIELAMVRRFIYSLVDDMKFKLALVTFDGFENTDFSQQLHRRRIRTGLLSADKSYAPYHDLREAIYEDRVSWPLYEVRSRKNEGEYFELAFSELTQLVDDGKKVDHTATSTKDLADAMAGVVHTLMTNPMLHRRGGKAPSSETTGLIEPTGGAYGAFTHPAYIGDRGVRKPDSLNSRNGSRL